MDWTEHCKCHLAGVKNRYAKWNPGKWQHGPKPAVPWWFNFDPHPSENSGRSLRPPARCSTARPLDLWARTRSESPWRALAIRSQGRKFPASTHMRDSVQLHSLLPQGYGCGSRLNRKPQVLVPMLPLTRVPFWNSGFLSHQDIMSCEDRMHHSNAGSQAPAGAPRKATRNKRGMVQRARDQTHQTRNP